MAIDEADEDFSYEDVRLNTDSNNILWLLTLGDYWRRCLNRERNAAVGFFAHNALISRSELFRNSQGAD